MTDPTPPAEAVEIAKMAIAERFVGGCSSDLEDIGSAVAEDHAMAALIALLRAGWKLEPPGGAG